MCHRCSSNRFLLALRLVPSDTLRRPPSGTYGHRDTHQCANAEPSLCVRAPLFPVHLFAKTRLDQLRVPPCDPLAPPPAAGRRARRSQLRNVLAVREAMKRAIHVGSRIRNHLNLSDLEGCALCVELLRSLAAHEVTDLWTGEAFVRDHSVLDGVTQVHVTRP